MSPGSAGDQLTLTQTGGSGTLSLGQIQNGIQSILYTAPKTIAASGLDQVSYTVNDPTQGTQATGSSTLQLDSGPSLTVASPAAVSANHQTILGTVSPGLTGDALFIKQTGGIGIVSLGNADANGVRQVLYTAPAKIGVDANDVVTYVVTDQHAAAAASGAATVALEATASLSAAAIQSIDGSTQHTTGILNGGHAVTLAVGTSLPVTVTGNPELLLNDGGHAVYTGQVNNQLLFSYTTDASNTSVSALKVTGIDLTGGAITGPHGLPADLSGAVATLSGVSVDTVAPTVMTVTGPSPNSIDGVGDIITVTLKLSESVTVTGDTASLTLNTGGTATYVGQSSDGGSLIFTYTVGSSDTNVESLAVTGVALAGMIVQDRAGNTADLTGAAVQFDHLQIDTTPPQLTGLTASTDNGASALNAGHTVTIALSADKALYVSGTPSLTLSDGRTAAYVGGSGQNTLRFQYTVATGDTDPDLHVTGFGTGGSVADRAGNALVRNVGQDLGLTIDTTRPTMTTLSAVSDTGATTLNAGHTITISVAANEAVLVDSTRGTPTLLLNDGRAATYEGGSGTKTLTFTYQVAPGDSASNLVVTALATNGGSVTDAAGNSIGTISGALGLTVDTTTPTILGVTASTDSGGRDLNVGHGITLSLSASRPVLVDTTDGTPSLTLTGGRVATYTGGSGTGTLTFSYQVAPGDNVADLQATGLFFNGSTISSAAGTALTGSASASLGLQLDTTAPGLTTVDAVSDSGSMDLAAGHRITVTLHTTEAVRVDTAGGVPQLTLNNGETAVYSGGSGSNALSFITTVRPGDDIDELRVNGLDLRGGQIRDGAGNNFAGSVSGGLGLQIDTTAPHAAVVATTDNGRLALNAGHTVTVTLYADSAIDVDQNKAPLQLALSDGAAATYTGGSGTTTLTFSYTVGAHDSAGDLTVTGLVANGASATDGAGNPLGVTGDLGLTIDTTAPTARLTAVSDGGAVLNAGHVVTITVTGSETLLVDTTAGGPSLSLNDGSRAQYVSGSGTPTLTFAYRVDAGDNVAALQVIGVDTSHGSITDSAGNPLGILDGSLGIGVDTTAPNATISAASDNGATALSAGHGVTITLHAGEPLTVDTHGDLPALDLSGGRTATYVSGSGTSTLTFQYQVEPGDNVADLTVLGLAANRGTIGDAAGNLLQPVASDLRFVIDTTAPLLQHIDAKPSATALPGQAVTITLSLSEPVSVQNGIPILTLSDGGTATYDPVATSALGDPSRLVFVHTVSFDQTTTPALTITGLLANGAAITDAAGNAANLAALPGTGLGVSVSTDIGWTATTPGDWNKAENWSANVVPHAHNTVVISGTASDDIRISGAEAAHSLTISDPNAFIRLSGSLTLETRLDVSGTLGLGIDGTANSTAAQITAPDGVTIETGGVLLERGYDDRIIGDVVNNSRGSSGLPGGVIVGGALDISGDLTGSGQTVLGGHLTVHGAIEQNIVFQNGGARLELGDPGHVSGTISGIVAGDLAAPTYRTNVAADRIDLAGVNPNSVNFDGAHVTFVDGNGVAGSIAVAGATAASLQDAKFQHVSDGQGGTAIFWQAGLPHAYVGPDGGAWGDAANWDDGIVPGAYDAVTIGGSAPVTVLIDANATASANHLNITNPAATIDVAGQLSLGIDPTLTGATIAVEGGTLALIPDTILSNGTVTLADGSIRIAPVSDIYLSPALIQHEFTVAADAHITQVSGTTNTAGVFVEGAFVNEGTITAGVSQGHFTISTSPNPNSNWSQPSIINGGTIAVSGGDGLQVSIIGIQSSNNSPGSGFTNSGTLTVGLNSFAAFDVTQWTNTGTMAVDGGATVTVGSQFSSGSAALSGLNPSWSNSGGISVASEANLTLYGGFATASLQGIVNTGTVTLNGPATDEGPISVQGGKWIHNPDSLASGSSGSGALISSNRYVIGDHTTLELAQNAQFSPVQTHAVQFSGSSSTLIVDHLANTSHYFGNPGDSSSGNAIPFPSFLVSGLEAGDSIDFAQAGVTSVQTVTNGFLVTGSFGSTLITSDQTFTPDEISVDSDGAQGTRLTVHSDTTAPTITAVKAELLAGQGGALPTTLAAGQDVTLTLTLREAVNVTGTPILRLSNGAVASYVSGSGSNSLSFTYTVQAGQDTGDLRLSSFDFSHGVIADAVGNSLSASLTGVPDADLRLAIDTQTPAVLSVSAPQGVISVGQSEVMTLQFSEAVTVTGGTPILLLNNAGHAIYDAAATQKLGDTTRLVFTYKVNVTDVSSAAPEITGLAINGAAIVNAAGTIADLSAVENHALSFGVDTKPSVAATGGVTYFLAQETTGADAHLWQTDGTAVGTHRVDLGDPTYFGVGKPVTTSNAVYVTVQKSVPDPNSSFGSSDPIAGGSGQTIDQTMLLRIGADGTVANLGAVDSSSHPYIAAETSLGGTLVLSINAGLSSGLSDGQAHLVATDGSGVLQTIGSFPLGLAPTSLIEAGGRLYFLAPPANGGQGSALWSTDGTPGGTNQVNLTYTASADPLDPNPSSGQPITLSDLSDLQSVGGELYFSASGSGVGHFQFDPGSQQVSANASATPVIVVGDQAYTIMDGKLNVQSSDGVTTLGTSTSHVTLVGNTVYFLGADSASGHQALFATHGTADTTREVTVGDDSVSGIDNLTAADGRLYFTAYGPGAGHATLWTSDGSTAGTHEIDPVGAALLNPSNLTADGSRVIFAATSPGTGNELWTSDGTAIGTHLIADIDPGTTSVPNTPVSGLTSAGELVFFSAYDPGTATAQLWRTDGTASGTTTLAPSTGTYTIASSPAALGNVVYFLSSRPESNDLWRSDGTGAGTVDLGQTSATNLISDGGKSVWGLGGSSLLHISADTGPVTVQSASGSFSQASGLIVSQGHAYFWALDASKQTSLWASDGTAGGTQEVAHGFEFPPLFAPVLSAADGQAYYTSQGGSGTVLNTVSRNAGSGYAITQVATAAVLTPYGATTNAVYFTKQDDPYGSGAPTLWRTDGITTTLVHAGSEGYVQNEVAAGDTLYFVAASPGSSQINLYASDSTGVRQITGDFTQLNYTTPVATNGGVLFSAVNASGQTVELSVANGSSTATPIDINSSGTIFGAATTGGTIVFAAQNGIVGSQVYAVAQGAAQLLTHGNTPADSNPSSIVVGPGSASSGMSGIAVDGYIAGGTVFADANGNGRWDPGEARTTTDAQGRFTLQGGSGPLVLTGGTDTSTGLNLSHNLTAPNGASVITPLTTLVQAVQQNLSVTLTEAEGITLKIFGITLSNNQSIFTADPVAGLLAGDSSAQTLYLTGVKILDTISLLSSTLSAQSGDPSGADAAAFSALASQIGSSVSAPGTTPNFDLNNIASLNYVITAAAAQTGVILSPQQASSLANIISSSNSAVDNAARSDVSETDLIQKTAAVQFVAQDLTASELQKGASPGMLQTFYTGSNLTQAISNASASVPCYCTGTGIKTVRGEVPVEDLSVGDLVITVTGDARAVKWIGIRRVDCRKAEKIESVFPVRVGAGAFAPGLPARDLFVSPDHAFYFDDVLICARSLINGSTVRQVQVDETTYHGIELDSHDMVMAEGVAAESYLDDGQRDRFDNYAGDGSDLDRTKAFSREASYRPLHIDGERVAAVRSWIDARARQLGQPPIYGSAIETGEGIDVELVPPSISGYLERISREAISGWVWQPADPSARVTLELVLDGIVKAVFKADQYRPDLALAAIGDGRYAFQLRLPPEAYEQEWADIGVRVRATGEHLTHSPALFSGGSNDERILVA